MLEIIANIIMVFGFIMILGSAGASDHNLVPLNVTILTASIGMAIILMGYVIVRKSENK